MHKPANRLPFEYFAMKHFSRICSAAHAMVGDWRRSAEFGRMIAPQGTGNL